MNERRPPTDEELTEQARAYADRFVEYGRVTALALLAGVAINVLWRISGQRQMTYLYLVKSLAERLVTAPPWVRPGEPPATAPGTEPVG